MRGTRPEALTKELSRNDTGETGGHQSGILIPKKPLILSFFPELDSGIKNPRCFLTFVDSTFQRWRFPFIYYNNKYFGGSRNEYRLTCMTRFIRTYNLKAGDTIILKRDSGGFYSILYRRRSESGMIRNGTLKLGSQWKVIEI